MDGVGRTVAGAHNDRLVIFPGGQLIFRRDDDLQAICHRRKVFAAGDSDRSIRFLRRSSDLSVSGNGGAAVNIALQSQRVGNFVLAVGPVGGVSSAGSSLAGQLGVTGIPAVEHLAVAHNIDRRVQTGGSIFVPVDNVNRPAVSQAEDVAGNAAQILDLLCYLIRRHIHGIDCSMFDRIYLGLSPGRIFKRQRNTGSAAVDDQRFVLIAYAIKITNAQRLHTGDVDGGQAAVEEHIQPQADLTVTCIKGRKRFILGILLECTFADLHGDAGQESHRFQRSIRYFAVGGKGTLPDFGHVGPNGHSFDLLIVVISVIGEGLVGNLRHLDPVDGTRDDHIFLGRIVDIGLVPGDDCGVRSILIAQLIGEVLPGPAYTAQGKFVRSALQHCVQGLHCLRGDRERYDRTGIVQSKCAPLCNRTGQLDGLFAGTCAIAEGIGTYRCQCGTGGQVGILLACVVKSRISNVLQLGGFGKINGCQLAAILKCAAADVFHVCAHGNTGQGSVRTVILISAGKHSLSDAGHKICSISNRHCVRDHDLTLLFSRLCQSGDHNRVGILPTECKILVGGQFLSNQGYLIAPLGTHVISVCIGRIKEELIAVQTGKAGVPDGTQLAALFKRHRKSGPGRLLALNGGSIRGKQGVSHLLHPGGDGYACNSRVGKGTVSDAGHGFGNGERLQRLSRTEKLCGKRINIGEILDFTQGFAAVECTLSRGRPRLKLCAKAGAACKSDRFDIRIGKSKGVYRAHGLRDGHAGKLSLLHGVAAQGGDSVFDGVSPRLLRQSEETQCKPVLTVLRGIALIDHVIFHIEGPFRMGGLLLNGAQLTALDQRIVADALHAGGNGNGADAGGAECMAADMGHAAALRKLHLSNAGICNVADHASRHFGPRSIQNCRNGHAPRGRVAGIILHCAAAGDGQGIGLGLGSALAGILIKAPDLIIVTGGVIEVVVVLLQRPACAVAAGSGQRNVCPLRRFLRPHRRRQ